MKKDEKIPSLMDKNWANENELGTIEEVIEYRCGEQTKRVVAIAHILSGAELEAIEAEYMKADAKTGDVQVNAEGFNRAKLMRIFRIDEKTLDGILKNKSSDFRTKMLMLSNRACGIVLNSDEIEKEKNSDSPVA